MTLALLGGAPVRTDRLPYARHWLDEDDIDAVSATLRSDWLTTGPAVERFERALAAWIGAEDAVAVGNGTAALHAALWALDIGPGQEVIVPALTFAASASAVLFQGATPVFADVEAGTLLLDPAAVEARLSPRTAAIIPVDYAGQPCDYDRLAGIAERAGVPLVADASHALGARYRDRPVGRLARLSTFSFHPAKHVTCGEGGAITTSDADLAARMRRFRNHGITATARDRAAGATWEYEIAELGYNYRLSDIHCALGLSQLPKLAAWLERRRAIARLYDDALADLAGVSPLTRAADRTHAHHLYVVRLDPEVIPVSRGEIFRALWAEGIGVNVHYIPVHLQPLYRERLGTRPGDCPVAETAYARMLTLPLFPRMRDADARDVVDALRKVVGHYARQPTRTPA